MIQGPSLRQTQSFQKTFKTEKKKTKRKKEREKERKPRGVSDWKRAVGKEELLPFFLTRLNTNVKIVS